MLKKIKKAAFSSEDLYEGDLFVVMYDNNSIEVFEYYLDRMNPLREFCYEENLGFEFDWSVNYLAKQILAPYGEEILGLANEEYCIYKTSEGVIVAGYKKEGVTKELLRDIANDSNISYEDSWNTQQLGRKVIESLKTQVQDPEGILCPNIGKRELSENNSLIWAIEDIQRKLKAIQDEQKYTLRVLIELKRDIVQVVEDSLEYFEYSQMDTEDMLPELRLEVLDFVKTDYARTDDIEETIQYWDIQREGDDYKRVIETYNYRIEAPDSYGGSSITIYALEEIEE